jgi:hypothetical protein
LFLLKKAFPPMIAAAKELALNPDNKNIHSKWQQTNNEVTIYLFVGSSIICLLIIVN